MKLHTFPRFLLFSVFLALFAVAAHARDLTISQGQKETIADSQTFSSGNFDNRGTLEIGPSGELKIGSGMTNPTPPGEGILGLGVVLNDGLVDAAQTIWFEEGSKVVGTVRSEKNVYFNGSATIEGIVDAKSLVFAKPENGKIDEPSRIDLSRGAELNVDTLAIYNAVKIQGETGKDLISLDADLFLGGSDAKLTVSGDLTVTGNFISKAGSSIVSDKEDWILTLAGGGEANEDGFNNLIAQSTFQVGELILQNNTEILNDMGVQGKLTLDKDSRTETHSILLTSQKMTFKEGASLVMGGDGSSMRSFGDYGDYFNGVFLDGFLMEAGSSLEAVVREGDSDAYLQLAIGANSEMKESATIKADHIYLVGVDSKGEYTNKTIDGRGTIHANGRLELRAVTLKNLGTVESNMLRLLYGSSLVLTGNELDNGGLRFEGKDSEVYIDKDSVLEAGSMTIDFGSTAVTNYNAQGGIKAASIVFGEGGSYRAGRVDGAEYGGSVHANAKFQAGSTLYLDYQSHADFANKDVVFETGSNIALSIKSGSVGSLITTGMITTQDDVVLSVADGSNFDGRTQQFVVLQGNRDSEFSEKLKFKDSLFFEMTDFGDVEFETKEGQKYLGLVVEIVKVADLVDYAGSRNQKNLSAMLDSMVENEFVPKDRAPVIDKLMNYGSDKAYRKALDDYSGSIRENSVFFALSSPWRVPLENVGFGRLSLALEKKRSPFEEDRKYFGQSPQRMMPSGPMSRGGGLAHDLWFHSYYHYDNIDSDHNTAGGTGNRGGMVLGSALPTPSREALLGISFGYSGGQFKQDDDKTDLNDYRIGLYGGANLFQRNLQIRGYVGYGFQQYDTDRAVRIEGLDPLYAHGKTDGTSVSAAVMLIRPVDMSDRWILKPTLGLDIEHLKQDEFTESGDAGATWRYGGLSLTRTMIRVGASSEYALRRASLTGRVMYGVKVAGDNNVTSRHFLPIDPSYAFDVSSVAIGPSVVDVGLGGNFGLNEAKTSLLFIDYTGTFSKNSNAHTASLGVLFKR